MFSDLSPFFSANEFARNGMLSGVPVCGILDLAYVSAGAGLGMSSTAPAFILPSSSVPASPVGQLLVVDGVTYAIALVEPDGTGVTTLTLERTA